METINLKRLAITAIACLVTLGSITIITTNPNIERLALNVAYSPHPFLDLQAVLAALDSLNYGEDPYKGSKFDPMNRPHVYGPWWFYLRFLHLGIKDTIWLGFIISYISLLISLLMIKELNFKRYILWFPIALSPPIILGLTRGNNDLWVLILVFLSSMVIRQGFPLLASLINVISYGLKFYPALLILYPITYITGRLKRTILAAGLCILSIILWYQWSLSMPPLSTLIPAPQGLWTFGGPNLFNEIKLDTEFSRYASILLSTLIVFLILLLSKPKLENLEIPNTTSYHLFIQCGVILLGTYALRENYSYRLLFLLGMYPYVISQLTTKNKDIAITWICGSLVVCWAEWLLVTPLLLLKTHGWIDSSSIILILEKSTIYKEIIYWAYFCINSYALIKLGNGRKLVEKWLK
jgi:hypothetical protein